MARIARALNDAGIPCPAAAGHGRNPSATMRSSAAASSAPRDTPAQHRPARRGHRPLRHPPRPLRALLETAEGPLLVPGTVIVEVCWLVEERPDIEAAFLESIAAGEFERAPITTADLTRMAELVRTYADLPLGAVDASVVAVAERLELADVATLDRRHFTVVRPRHAYALNLLP